jgi:hypothetical protein
MRPGNFGFRAVLLDKAKSAVPAADFATKYRGEEKMKKFESFDMIVNRNCEIKKWINIKIV